MPGKDNKIIKVGSRKSQLALIQTEFVIAELKKIHTDHEFEIVTISTTGDKILDVALSKIGEKALFTKELEVALEKEEVDFVVHSLKDLPTSLPPGMVVGGVMEREDPRDALVIKSGSDVRSLSGLPAGSVLGTSSLRRAAQLRQKHPGLVFNDVRGNLNTRFRKLDDKDGKYAGLILAAAGVSRMGWADRITEHLSPDCCLHAVGQGALGIECREDDRDTLALLEVLNHRDTVLATVAERAFMKKLEGGCSVPVGVSTVVDDSSVRLVGGVWSLDGTEFLKGEEEGEFQEKDEGSPPKKTKNGDLPGTFAAIKAENLDQDELSTAEQVGSKLAQQLIDQGADKILREAKSQNEKS